MIRQQSGHPALETDQGLPGLYDPRFEHDSCGIGAVVNMKGIRSHRTVEQALHIVENLEHRAGKDGEGKTGDVSVSCFRFPTDFSGRSQSLLESGWETREGMVSACFFSPGICWPEIRP